MKIIPSIFLALFFISCDDSNVIKESDNPTTEKISLLLEKSNQKEISFSEKKSVLDSAIVLSKTIQSDSLLLEALRNKADLYFYQFPDSSKVYIGELEKTALQKNSLNLQAYASSLYGNYLYNRSEYDSAYYHYKKSNILYFEKQDSLRIVYNLIMMARIHQFFNDYSSSEELATESLNYLKDTNNAYIIEVYNILGHTYLSTENYEEAIKFYEESLGFVDNIKDQIILKNNKASVYIHSGKYELALKTLEELLQLEDINGDLNAKSLVLFNIGHAQFKLDKNKGLEELEESLKIRQNINNQMGAIEGHIKLAQYYEDKDKSIAKKHLREAVKLAKAYKNIDNHLSALKILIRLSDKEDLKYYSKEYIHLNDSITEVRRNAKNQFAKMRFDYSKEQEQNLLLKTKKAEDELLIQKQKNTNQLLFFGLLFAGISGISLYLIIRNKHKREKIQENYKTENRIAVRIHDELANDVYNTIAYTESSDLSLEENKLKLLDNLEDFYNRTRNISKENSLVDTGEYYLESLKNMLSEYQKNELKIIIAGADNIQWKEINSHKKIIIYRVLQELMVNMKKHSGASMVMIRFQDKNKQVNIHYSDDGVGLSDEKIILRNGLQNVENRIKAINGTVTFDPKTGKGLKILIAFPL